MNKTSANELTNNAINLLIAMVVEDLAKDTNRDASEVLSDFIASRTAHNLYNEESKLWWNGPSAIEEMYMQENGESFEGRV